MLAYLRSPAFLAPALDALVRALACRHDALPKSSPCSECSFRGCSVPRTAWLSNMPRGSAEPRSVHAFVTLCFALADGSPCQTAAWFEVMTVEGRIRKLALLPLLIDRLDASIAPTAVCPADASEDLPQLSAMQSVWTRAVFCSFLASEEFRSDGWCCFVCFVAPKPFVNSKAVQSCTRTIS